LPGLAVEDEIFLCLEIYHSTECSTLEAYPSSDSIRLLSFCSCDARALYKSVAKNANNQNTLESWLAQGPYTLSLCSHFFGFYSHTAIVEQLYKIEHRPSKITGTSAGALVGAALASGHGPKDFKDILFSKSVKDYWDPKLGLGLLAGKKFLALLQSFFAPDFSQTKIPLEVGVTELPFFKHKFLSQGNLPEAVLASCAVPGMFPPVKVEKRWYYDGGVMQKTGISPNQQHDRVLNIYLDVSETLLKKNIFQKKLNLGPNHRILYLPNAPRVNPRNLTTGHLAHQETLKRAELLFKNEFKGNKLII
jgi:NTE family protein